MLSAERVEELLAAHGPACPVYCADGHTLLLRQLVHLHQRDTSGQGSLVGLPKDLVDDAHVDKPATSLQPFAPRVRTVPTEQPLVVAGGHSKERRYQRGSIQGPMSRGEHTTDRVSTRI